MQATPESSTEAASPLQLVLFVDRRPSAREQIRQVRQTLQELQAQCAFDLQIVDVSEQPYLAEHFRLIATPALVKIHPEPKQTLAGTDLVAQVKHWWSQWQKSVEDYIGAIPSWDAIDSLATDRSLDNQRAEPTAATPENPSVRTTPETAGTGRPPSIARSTEIIRLSDTIFQLQREKEDLEHQLKFKDQIISMLAHDLRNPLTAASLALETLELGYRAKEQGEDSGCLTPALTSQLLKHARSQTKAIDRMITDILQAAKGNQSELQLKPEKLNLGILCQSVLTDLNDLFEAKSQHWEQDIPSDLPFVWADSERVRQVLVNLLDNASKYTPVGGTIQISILHRTTQKVQVSICDTGPGIPEENRDSIFEERFRLQRDVQQDGYGIGLALCQRIIRAHYGQIWVDSSAHQGSCFHFTLPVLRS